jgi:hypothetical protein
MKGSYGGNEQPSSEDAIQNDNDGRCSDQSIKLSSLEVSGPDWKEVGRGAFMGVEQVEGSRGTCKNGEIDDEG